MAGISERIIDRLKAVNRLIALAMGAGLLLCAAFILAEILVRQLGGSLGGTDEIAGYVMAIVTSWGMAYCLLELGHVRIDFLRGCFASRGRAVLDLICMATLAAVASVIAYKCWPVVERSLVNGSRANTPLETPLALVQVPWFMGWAWFALSAWITLVAATFLVLQSRLKEAESVAGVFAEADAAAREAEAAT
ncbi:TRAP transporter small permease subunit [Roseibium denhamense]|uniref:TRAP transporter small permease protein n=1 Tax=Roseibium denhamense TaxID=76305 RepID=A0ABY1NPJ6_9HYPH|nr:TRAP transporter small permease [Roseibium denhamense]SMP14962.1 TRAP-type mannitol/chloroaromatic compound transport system, small permease component [Roseibium denhamense]